MEYDREESRRRREYDDALAQQKKLEEKLAGLKRAARTAKSRLLSSTTKSETWHRMTLGWLDREAGYTGEMASARFYLRCLPVHDYVRAIAVFAEAMPTATNLQIEVAAVEANLAEWTARGDAQLLHRAKQDYAVESASFAEWQHDHPEHEAWRRKPMTRGQGFLIARMTTVLDVEPPGKMNRGEAHDWIARHGGNPRLAPEPEPVPTPPKPLPARLATATPVAVDRRDEADDAAHPGEEKSW